MDKPGFSPVLLIGLGGAGLRVIEQTRKYLKSLPQPLQELVEVLPLDGSAGSVWTENLQAAVNRLKAGSLLQQAEAEARVSIRRSSGPLEINVFLAGRLGSSPGGLGMDAVLNELVRTGYAWSPELGFTGASVTVLALMGGKDAGQKSVLNRMLETYRSDEFLDAYRGRIFLLDNYLQDGSKIEQSELVSLVARALWLSIVPGDEPLLLRELGLIRMYEKEAKLAAIGMDCYYLPSQESLYRQAARQLRQQADRLMRLRTARRCAAEEHELYPGTGATSQSLSAEFETGLTEVPARFRQELEQKLSGRNPEEALAALAGLENWLEQKERVPEQAGLKQGGTGCNSDSAPVPRADTEMLMMEQADLRRGRVKISRASLLGIFAAAALYRLASNQIIPIWLVWLFGLVSLTVLLLLVIGSRPDFGPWKRRLQGQTVRPPVDDLPREFGTEEIPVPAADMEELRRECLSARWELVRLGRTLKETAGELEKGRPPLMARPLPLGGELPLLPEKLVPPGWREMQEEECRQVILSSLTELAEAEFASRRNFQFQPELADPVPLLIYREGTRPLRRAKVIEPLSGRENLICVTGMYFGLEPNHISLP